MHELQNEMQVGVQAHCDPINGFTGGPGDEGLEKFTDCDASVSDEK